MKVRVELRGKDLCADLSAPIDLSTAIEFGGAQPRFFELPAATQAAVRGAGFIGDAAQGPCNCRTLTITPHGNGTHTESLQHLQSDAPAPPEALTAALLEAHLISVSTTTLGACGERYNSYGEADDSVLSAAALEAALPPSSGAALIVRSEPNSATKATADYDARPAPYLTFNAIDLIAARGISHLLLDLPSIDRGDDGGELPNHHRFWDARGERATITEMIFVPDHARDGHYLLNLQLPNLRTDAVPSRPLIFALEETLG